MSLVNLSIGQSRDEMSVTFGHPRGRFGQWSPADAICPDRHQNKGWQTGGVPVARDGVDHNPDRWVEARDVLDEVANPSAQRRQRRLRNRLVLLLVGAVVLSGLVAWLIAGLVGTGGHRPDSGVSTWRNAAATVFDVLSVLVIIGAAGGLIRARQWGSRWRASSAVLTMSQRRQLFRQVRGRAPVDPQRIPLARELATRLANLRWLLAMYLGIFLGQAGQLFASTHLWHAVFIAVEFVLFLAAGVQVWRDSVRARRFLADHPASPTETPVPTAP